MNIQRLFKAGRLRVAGIWHESLLSDLVILNFAIAVLILTECILAKEMRVLELSVRSGFRIEEHVRLA